MARIDRSPCWLTKLRRPNPFLASATIDNSSGNGWSGDHNKLCRLSLALFSPYRVRLSLSLCFCVFICSMSLSFSLCEQTTNYVNNTLSVYHSYEVFSAIRGVRICLTMLWIHSKYGTAASNAKFGVPPPLSVILNCNLITSPNYRIRQSTIDMSKPLNLFSLL